MSDENASTTETFVHRIKTPKLKEHLANLCRRDWEGENVKVETATVVQELQRRHANGIK